VKSDLRHRVTHSSSAHNKHLRFTPGSQVFLSDTGYCIPREFLKPCYAAEVCGQEYFALLNNRFQ